MFACMGWLEEVLSELEDMGPRGGLERFRASLEPEWIEAALEATGTTSIRRRKLPANQVVWLVLGMALYTDRSVTAVLDHLGLVRGDADGVAASAVSKARYRLGAEPLQWLFERVAAKWSGESAIGGYCGLSVYGIDGTHLRVPDSDENFEHFGKPGGRSGSNDAGYPQLRLVAVMNLANRLLSAVRVAPISTSERALASELWDAIPDESLVIADRGFLSYGTLFELVANRDERHFLFRMKSDTPHDKTEDLPDGTALALLSRPTSVKRADAENAEPLEVRIVEYQHSGGQPARLVTTLLDHERYPADELIELYHDRWDLEIAFDELKTHMLDRAEALRSRKPEGVYQEFWALLLVYNLVRREMYLTAVDADVPANRISFRTSLLYIRDLWTTGWMISPGNVPRTLAQLRQKLRGLVLPERRRQRRYPRHVKIKMSNYPRNRGKRSTC